VTLAVLETGGKGEGKKWACRLVSTRIRARYLPAAEVQAPTAAAESALLQQKVPNLLQLGLKAQQHAEWSAASASPSLPPAGPPVPASPAPLWETCAIVPNPLSVLCSATTSGSDLVQTFVRVGGGRR
jgi:hypothetical protein